jgi:gas vesicle protein
MENEQKGERMSAGKLLLGVVIAGATGAILGVLFAPAKGSETRKRIADKGVQFAGKGEDRMTAYVGALTDSYGAYQDSAMDWADMGGAQVFSGTGMRMAR